MIIQLLFATYKYFDRMRLQRICLLSVHVVWGNCLLLALDCACKSFGPDRIKINNCRKTHALDSKYVARILSKYFHVANTIFKKWRQWTFEFKRMIFRVFEHRCIRLIAVDVICIFDRQTIWRTICVYINVVRPRLRDFKLDAGNVFRGD